MTLTSGGAVDRDGATIPGTWTADARSNKIEGLLFGERRIDRRLRVAASGYGHAKLNLVRVGRTTRPGRSLSELTRALRQLV
jgi:hypothetical protein